MQSAQDAPSNTFLSSSSTSTPTPPPAPVPASTSSNSFPFSSLPRPNLALSKSVLTSILTKLSQQARSTSPANPPQSSSSVPKQSGSETGTRIRPVSETGTGIRPVGSAGSSVELKNTAVSTAGEREGTSEGKKVDTGQDGGRKEVSITASSSDSVSSGETARAAKSASPAPSRDVLVSRTPTTIELRTKQSKVRTSIAWT